MKWIAIFSVLLASASISAYAQDTHNDYDVIFAPSPHAPLAEQGVMIGIERHLDQTTVVGAFGTILTRQGNAEWQQANVPTSVLLTAVHYIDSERIWVTGHDGVILHSLDGGETWQRKLDGHQLLELELEWLAAREEYLTTRMDEASDDEEAYEYEYLLDELSFQSQAAEIQLEVGPTKPLFDIQFISQTHGFAIGAFGLLLETQDAGESWNMVNERLDNPTGYHLNKIISNQDNELFIIAEAGLLFRSIDSGATWEPLDSPYHGSLFGGLFDQQGRFWVYGLRGNVFVSDDNGDSFTSVDANTRYNLNAGTLMADGTVVLAGHSGTLVFFDPNTLEAERFEHSSNVPLSGVLQNAGSDFILVGRGGVMQFMYSAGSAH